MSEVSHFSGFNSRGGQLPGLSGETERTEMVFVFFFLYSKLCKYIFVFFPVVWVHPRGSVVSVAHQLGSERK